MDNYLETLLEEPIPRERSFPEEEYDARLARVRARMAEQGIELLLVHSAVDLCYLTGYQTLWPDAYACLAVPAAGELFMQVGAIEASCAVLHGDVKDLTLFDWVGSASAPAQLARLLRQRGYAGRRIGVQMGRIEMGNRGPVDAALYRELKTALPDAELIDATYLMFDVRVRKSPLEIAHLAEAARITGAGMEAAIAAVRPGLTENDIAATAAQVMIAAGSEFFSIDPIVNTGHRTGYFHTTFKRFPIEPDHHVQIELGGVYHRYTAPLMRTVVLGRPSDLVRRIIDAQLAALDRLYSNVRAGRTAHEIALETRTAVAGVDDLIFRSGHFGYSVGLGFPPTWTDGPMYIAEGNHRELEPGMVFHTPFSWRIPKKFVIGTSETIVVTDTGCDILSQAPRQVPIKSVSK